MPPVLSGPRPLPLVALAASLASVERMPRIAIYFRDELGLEADVSREAERLVLCAE